MKIEPNEKNLKEQIPYPDKTFPFCVWPDVYNLFVNRTVNAHWHYDFEYGYVLSGSVDYYINDTFIRLQTGDCVFINSNMLHMSRQPDDCDNAVMFTITFSTTLLTPDINSTIYAKYFQPIINTHLEGFRITSNDPFGLKLAVLLLELLVIQSPEYLLNSKTIPASYKKYFQNITDPKFGEFRFDMIESPIYQDVAPRLKEYAKMDGFGYELECMKRVCEILLLTLRHIKENKSDVLWHANSLNQIERAKEIIAFIHTHYAEKITVEDIAYHIGISRSECFRCFKRFTNKRPVEYIIEYRLSKAAKLLRETETSVMAISLICGFENSSYFGKTFKKKYAVTPLQYRKLGMDYNINPL